MRQLILILVAALLVSSCKEAKIKEISSINPVNWKKREVNFSLSDSLEFGRTYLSVYSQIYSLTEHRKHNLTATISIRNTAVTDTIFLFKAAYYDTKGKLIRNYFDHPIFLSPLETVAIVIDEVDKAGGTGANFIFDWKVKSNTNEPLFEGIMISTSGQQGLSFTTQGKRIG